ncbi:hypothetical protein GCM10020220_071220 [Nonomuraea rubra]
MVDRFGVASFEAVSLALLRQRLRPHLSGEHHITPVVQNERHREIVPAVVPYAAVARPSGFGPREILVTMSAMEIEVDRI